MQVVLLEPVKNLGQTGEVVEVKNGFARNYLIPRGVALRASKENLVQFEEQKKEIEKRNGEKSKAAEELAKKLDGLAVTIIRQAAEDGRLYGSVTVREIAQQIAESEKLDVESKAIDLLNPIKTVGKTEVNVSLYAGVEAKITVNVARSESEAEKQLLNELDEEAEAAELEKQKAIEGAIKAAEAAQRAQEQAEAEAANAESSEEAEVADTAAEETAEAPAEEK